MNRHKVVLCQSPEQNQSWLNLRWNILRAPWKTEDYRRHDEASLPPGPRALILDAQQRAIACGQLCWPERGIAQIRNMAVDPGFQSQGFGLAVLQTLEQWAGLRGAEKVIAMARDTSLGFYSQAGFRLGAEGPRLFDQIPHHWVEKPLPQTDFAAMGLHVAAASNDDSRSLMRFIFKVLDAYGLEPETDGIDQDLVAPEQTYAGGFFHLLRDKQQELVGTIALLPRERGTVELRRMYVHPDWRGRGLGKACLGYAMRCGRELGFQRMSLETASVLKEALALYQRAGFESTAGERHARRCDLYMELDNF